MTLSPRSSESQQLRGPAAWALVLVSLSPVYFDVATGTTNAAVLLLVPSRPMVQPIHSALLLPLALVALFLFRLVGAQRRSTVVAVPFSVRMLFGIFVIFSTGGMISALAGPAASWDRYLQTLLVVAPLFLGRMVRISPGLLERLILISAAVSTGVMSAFVVRTAGLGGLGGRSRFAIADSLPQILIYLPFAAVVSIAGALLLNSQPIGLRLFAGATGLSFMVVNYSRTAILLGVGSMLLAGFIASRTESPRRRARYSFGAVVGTFLIVVASLSSVAGERSLGSGVESGRIAIARNALSRVARSPLFGEGFIPRSADNLRPYDTHNQFLEFLLRGGLIGGVAMLLLTVIVLKELRAKASGGAEWRPLGRLAFVVFGTALLGGLGNPYLTQLFPGVFIWFLVGVLLANGTAGRFPAASGTTPRDLEYSSTSA